MFSEDTEIKKEFYENGKLKNEATYKSGKKNGTLFCYSTSTNNLMRVCL